MVKRQTSANRLLAVLLCVCMLLSLVPAAAAEELAAGAPPQETQEGAQPQDPPAGEDGGGKTDAPAVQPEESEGVPSDSNDPSSPEDAAAPGEGGDVQAPEDALDPLSETLPQDGAVADTWAQDPDTLVTGSVAPAVEDGKLKLTAVTANANNCDGDVPPAFFTNAKLDTALAAAEGEKELSFTMTPNSTTDNICLGISLNYTTRRQNVFIGYNTLGGWFVQYYGGTGAYPTFSGPVLQKGRPYTVELKWTDAAITEFKVGGTACALPNGGGFGSVPVADRVAIKAGKDTQSGGVTSLTISDFHYTGQATTTYYSVSGAVTKSGGSEPVEGATVAIAGKTATTDVSGAYTISGLLPGTHAVAVTKDGYRDGAFEVTIADGDLSAENFSLVEIKNYDISGTVKDDAGQPIAGAAVTAGGRSAVSGPDGGYTLPQLEGGREYPLLAVKGGYAESRTTLTVDESGAATGADIVLTPSAATAVLSSGTLDVVVSTAFPQAIQYIMDGKIMYGQTEALDTLVINGVQVVPTVTCEAAGDRADYRMTVKDDANHIYADIYADLALDGNVLTFEITRIDSRTDRLEYPLQSIFIPNHSLVSVRGAAAEDGNLMAAKLAASTITKGDFYYTVDQAAGVNGQRYMYAFVSGNGLSAGVSSNSQVGGAAAGSDNNRITVSGGTLADGTTKTIGLGSSLWYYDRYVGDSYNNSRHIAAVPADQRVVGPSGDEMPFYLKVVITGDQNDDGQVDWQDGAIAARDQGVAHKPYKGGEVPDIISTRIAMNFGSQAQNPFLTTLDNVKRVALNTDGLGQGILLKGYASEGHDSGHPDYYDIGQRMGGPKDMNAMMEQGKAYGARFGIHVNASEFYPEADAFSEESLSLNENGTKRYGWEWLDQGVAMNGLYDLATGLRRERFDKLKAEVGDNLDFVYVDVWGNNTSGSEDAWQTRKLDQDLTENGWRIANEWGYANEWNSTFQHWVSDYTYGDYGQKGKYNSEVYRILFNSCKDTFAPDFAHMGGCANAPLLGGAVMQGFEGWQGDGEYDLAMEAIFEHMLPAKFLQHYDIMKWTDNDAPVSLPYAANAGGGPGKNTNWTPEVQITLQNPGRDSTVVVTRGSDTAVNDTYAYGTDEEKLEYRSRTITLDGREILRGAPIPAGGVGNGDSADMHALGALANQQYLIPWLWDTEGNALASGQEKLYHRNDKGGDSTWDLPSGWESLATVKMYRLTDTGRTDERTIPVADGRVTLPSEAGVSYVVVRGENGAAAPTVEWSTGMHLKDVSFNAANVMDNWMISGSGDAVRYATARQIPMLKMTGEVSVSQVMTDLTPGVQYAVYVGVDNRSDAKASMSVSVDGAVAASNYTLRSIAKNYVSAYAHHTGMPVEAGSSYFQNMYVFFTAPQSGKVVFTLSREAGGGNVYFDDVRVVENPSRNAVYDGSGALISFTQDFETEAQGLYPFVVGGVEGVADNRQHLAKRHAPYTQVGWDNGIKRLDDVIGGDWSLKINGKAGANNLCFQTLPQTVRFAPGVTYDVSFDYEMGAMGGYSVVCGTGEFKGLGGVQKIELLPARDGKVGRCTFSLTGDPTGETWFGVYSDSASVDAPQNSDLNNFILDNLSVRRSRTDKSALAELVARAEGMKQADYSGDWAAMATALLHAKVALSDPDASQSEVDARADALEKALGGLTKNNVILSGTVTLGGVPVEGASLTLMDSGYRAVHSAVTGADGAYTFDGMGGGTYYVKTTAAGCELKTVSVSGLDNGSHTKDIAMEPYVPAPYELRFEDGDVSMMTGLTASDTTFTVTPVQYNGSGAMKIHFTGNRTTNNVVFDGVSLKNGTFAFDMTALNAGSRFGADLRAVNANSRIFLGTFDNSGQGGLEWWYNGGNDYPGGTAGPGFTKGVTRHVEITMKDQHFTMKVDGISMFDANVNGAPPNAGKIGFVFGNGSGTSDSSFIIDNVRITPADGAAPAGHTVTGRVLCGGQGVPGAQVVIKSGETVAARTGADGSGVYTASLADGAYTVAVTAAGYSAGTGAVTVAGAAVTAADITLTVDKAQLQALYDDNKDKENENYTEESWTAFTDALDAAKAVLDDASVGQSAVSKAYGGLSDALSGLMAQPPAPVNKALLRTYYNAYNAYLKADFEDAGWDAFVAALQAANAVLRDAGATQAQVDAAADALVAAEAALVRIAQGGGSSGGGSGTVTETIQNPDGSTTVKVTDKKTGAVTETTTDKHGTKTVIVTGKDGSVTATATLSGREEGVVTLPGKALPVGAAVTVRTTKPAAVTIPVEASKPGVVAYLVKADGTEELVKKSVTGGDGVTLKLEGSAMLRLADNGKTFSDVSAGNWAHDAVAFAASRELFQGVGGDRFAPADPMTRSMLVTVLYRLENEPQAGGNAFTDVPGGAWYTDAVAWASASGIVTGTGAGFDPDGEITRESLAVMLYRYAEKLGLDTGAGGAALRDFPDGGSVSGWAGEAMGWAVDRGILSGRTGGVLDASGTASRAEVATMLMRFVGLLVQ